MSIYTEKKKPVKKPRLTRTLALLVLCLSCQISVVNATTDTWVANGDGTVTDVATGLIWQQQDDAMTRTHAAAITYCQGLPLAGGNWRLPNIKELISIVDYRSDRPAIDEKAFTNTNSSLYWSATSLARNSSGAWVVDTNGGVGSTPKANGTITLVRCVR